MTVSVKICGITLLEDALAAVQYGADALGFNFYPQSPRYIEPRMAEILLQDIPPSIHRVGVFVDDDPRTVADIAVSLELDCLQFHGSESPEYCDSFGRPWYKAFRLHKPEDLAAIAAYDSPWLMVDAYSPLTLGGTGELARFDLALEAKTYGKLVLAGGLRPENILAALDAVAPEAVDVASGVETQPGIKDHLRMESFISKVKQWKHA